MNFKQCIGVGSLSLIAAISAAAQNKVLSLDAPGEYAIVPNNVSQTTSDAITIEFLARFDNPNPNAVFGRPVSKRSGSDAQFSINFGEFCVSPTQSGTTAEIYGAPGTGGGVGVGWGTCDIVIPRNRWFHYALTWSRNSRVVRVYVDGSLIFQSEQTSDAPLGYRTDPIRFGDWGDFTNWLFIGRLDNIRIWNVERTQGEIVANALRQFSQAEAIAAVGLIGSWTFEDGTASSGTGQNHAGLINGASIAVDDSLWSVIDCSGDQIPDRYQISTGALSDINGDGLPDSVTVSVQPADQTVASGGTVLFVTEVIADAGCATPPSFQWQRRNPVISDPEADGAWINLTDGGGFVNTNTAALGIQYPNPAIATGYRCRISGGCGCSPIYTDVVNFSVNCPADFDGNGGIDGGDLAAFFEHFEAGC